MLKNQNKFSISQRYIDITLIIRCSIRRTCCLVYVSSVIQTNSVTSGAQISSNLLKQTQQSTSSYINVAYLAKSIAAVPTNWSFPRKTAIWERNRSTQFTARQSVSSLSLYSTATYDSNYNMKVKIIAYLNQPINEN